MEKFNLSMSQKSFARDLPSRDSKNRAFRSSRQNFNKQLAPLDSSDQPPYHINLINLTVDEQQFLSNSKIDLLNIQENINRLDLDQRIRTTPPNDLEKPPLKEIKRFINRLSPVNGSQVLDSRMKQEFNEQEFLSFLKVPDSTEGLKKLFRILQILDVMVQKVTEQELVFLLKYDSLFEDMTTGKSRLGAQSKFSQMAQGVHLNRFWGVLANLERHEELFSCSSKLHAIANNTPAQEDNKIMAQGGNTKIRQIQTIEELQAGLSTGLFDLDKQQTNKITEILDRAAEQSVLQTQKIDKQAHDIAALQDKVAKLKKQIENQETSVNTTRSGFFQNNDQQDAEYYHKVVQEIEQQYESRIGKIEEENKKLSLLNGELCSAKDGLQHQLIQLQDEMLSELKAKDTIIQQIQKTFETSTEFEDCFEDALRESFMKMKTVYQERLEQREQDILQVQKKRNIEVYDLKQENKRESETKRLLMKKLSLFIKI